MNPAQYAETKEYAGGYGEQKAASASIEAKLQEQAKSLAELREIVAELERRLYPVLTHEPRPVGSASADNAKQPPDSFHVLQATQKAIGRIQDISDAARGILARLQL